MSKAKINKKILKKSDDVMSMGRLAWNNFKKNKLAIIGAVIFIVILILLILAPVITPANGQKTNLKNKLQPPSKEHILGTDDVGRDMWTRLIYGGRNSLVVAVISTIIGTIIGSIIGSVSGYYGGRIGNLLMRFTEIIQTFPYLPTMIVISYALQNKIKPENKIYLMAFIIGALGWTSLARMVRGQILSLREQEFMEAATALGISDLSKVFKHLLPNTLGFIIVSTMLSFAGGILAEVSLSFLGLGVSPPNPSWGNILNYARKSDHLRLHWWMWIPCALVVILSVVGVNLMGEGLRDAFDPKSNK